MMSLMRRLFVRSWNVKYTWINLREQIIGSLILFTLVYPFALHIESIPLFLALLLGVSLKEIITFLRRIETMDPLYFTREFYKDIIFNIFAVGSAYTFAMWVKGTTLSPLSTFLSIFIPAIILLVAWDLNQYFFSPDGSFGIYKEHHYIFSEEGVKYLGKHPDPDALIEEWEIKRQEGFIDAYLDRMTKENLNRQKNRWGFKS